MLAAVVSVILAVVLCPQDEAFALGLGIALGAAGVLLIWSLVLAARSWRRGNHSGWVWAVLVAGGLEAVVFGIPILFLALREPGLGVFLGWLYLASEADRIGWALSTNAFPFLPVGVCAYLVAASITWWRLRRAAKRDAQAGIHGKSHWRRGLIWFCAVSALMVALLLPCPLFMYCLGIGYDDPAPAHWKKYVREHTPVVVAEAAAWMVSLSSHWQAVESYCKALMSGRVSTRRLLAEVNATDPAIAFGAMQGLERANPQAALGVAENVGRGEVSAASLDLCRWAGDVLGQHETPERVREYLSQVGTQWPLPHYEFTNHLLCGLAPRREFLPELISFCKHDLPNREDALRELAWTLPKEDLPTFWAALLSDSESLRRQQAIKVLPDVQPANMRLLLCAASLEHPDPAVRKDVQQSLFLQPVYLDFKSADREVVKRFVHDLLLLLDDNNLATRRDSAMALAWLVAEDEAGLLEPGFEEKLRQCLRKDPVPPETLEEIEMLGAVRTAAKKWLQRQ